MKKNILGISLIKPSDIKKSLEKSIAQQEFRKKMARGHLITFTIEEVEKLTEPSTIRESFNSIILIESCKILFNSVENGRYTTSFCEAFGQLCWSMTDEVDLDSSYKIRVYSSDACSLLNNYCITTPRGLCFSSSIADYIFDNHLSFSKIKKIIISLESRFVEFSNSIEKTQRNIKNVQQTNPFDKEAFELRYINSKFKFYPKSKKEID
ncbi:hypothetical protein [Pseudocolwellia agarivorans]|uniref:hypothetical protein n=1 Tax=Pseudocolwellia agarivorans TaxID=1911682 RepID=UPI000985C01A|nr:hypothetical protein [Pseudocolwellia agarivorans]